MPSDARPSRGTTTAVAPDCGPSPLSESPDPHTIGADVGPPPIRLISKSDLLKRVPLSFPTIWKMMQQGRFPRARVIGGKSVWIESEVNDFLAALPLRQYKDDGR
jgi:prophage regulatory protein